MATIHKEIEIQKSKEFVWDAIRDVGAIHKRLARGFVKDCVLEDGARIVTFADGMVIRELIVDIDDNKCRHSWSAIGEPIIHHNASLQVFSDDPNRCRVVWVADLLPNEIAGSISNIIQQGLNAMKNTLENGDDYYLSEELNRPNL
jgi:Polyketide cyclase / dehydrase and lipid transport